MSPTTADGMPPTEEPLQQLREIINSTPEAVAAEAVTLDQLTAFGKDLKKSIYRQVIVGVGILLLVVILAFGLNASRIGALGSAVNDQGATLREQTAVLDGLQVQLDSANSQLMAKGLPPVTAPRDPVPGSADDARLRVAAATATTLNALPREVVRTNGMSSAQLAGAAAKAVNEYFVANPIVASGVSPQQVADGVAKYFAAHPVPKAAAPTSGQIMDSFIQAVRANPQSLCASGGTYGKQKVVTVDDNGVTRSTIQYGCFGPSGEMTSLPAPSSSGGSNQAPSTSTEKPAPTTANQAPAAPHASSTPSPSTSDSGTPLVPGIGG